MNKRNCIHDDCENPARDDSRYCDGHELKPRQMESNLPSPEVMIFFYVVLCVFGFGVIVGSAL